MKTLALLLGAVIALAAGVRSAEAEILRYSCRAVEDRELTFSIVVDTAASTVINTWDTRCHYCSFCSQCPVPKMRATISNQHITWIDPDDNPRIPVRVDRATREYQYLKANRWITSGTCSGGGTQVVPDSADCPSLAGTWTRSALFLSQSATFHADHTGSNEAGYNFTWRCLGNRSYELKFEESETERGTLSADGRTLTTRTDVARITYVRRSGP